MKHIKDVYFNMNNPVTVLLTEQGVSFLENHHKHRREWHLNQSIGKLDIGEFKRPENNLYKTSMWNMIDIFGKLEMWELDQHISMEVTLGVVSIEEDSAYSREEEARKRMQDFDDRWDERKRKEKEEAE